MRSWSLKKYVDQYGLNKAARVWGISRQAISKAIENDRAIQITLIDDVYEVHESKVLSTKHSSYVEFL